MDFAKSTSSSRGQRRSMICQMSTASSASTTSIAGVRPMNAMWKKWKIIDRAMNASLALQQAITTKIDNRPAVVIEIGTRLTRIGFAGEFVPREIFRTEWLDPMDGPPTAPSLRPKPIFDRNRSEQEQFEMLVKFLKNIVFRKLLTTISSRRIVLVESLLTPTWQRQALANALFSCPSLSPHSLLFAPSHLLASLPFNARTCVVLDLGANEAVLFPIAEGILMLNNWETSSNASATAVEANLRKLMLQFGRVCRKMVSEEEEERVAEDDSGRALNERDMELAERMDLWEDLVLRFCFVTTAARGRRLQAHLANLAGEAKIDLQASPPLIQLQFGAEILQIPGIVREAAAEILFTQNDEPDCRSVPQMLLDCLSNVGIDLRRELLANLLVIGGISRMPGFLARLKTELLNLIADGYRPQLAPTLVDIKFYQFPREMAGQLFCNWLGGSMFGSLDDSLEQRSLTRRQWEQRGKRVPDWTNQIDEYFADLVPAAKKSIKSADPTLANAEGTEGS